MKKKISISIALLIFIVIGYSIKSPSNIVETYFQNIKSGTNNPITVSMFSSMDNVNDNSDTKKITDSLINSLSKLDVEILDESKNGDTSTVTVKAKGISLYTTLNEVYDILKTDECLKTIANMNEIELETYFTSLLLEAINNAKIEERTVTLNLTRVNKRWQIDEYDETFQEALWGMTEKKLAKITL